MNDPDSISDPVAHRLCCTESYPSARGSASQQLGSTRLDLARLAADDVAGGFHCADVAADWALTWHAYYACCCHNYVMLTSSISGSVTWVGSTGIRVGSAHPGEEDAWGASARVGKRLVGE